MAVYAVITPGSSALVDAKVMELYAGRNYKYAHNVWIVSTSESATALSNSLGCKQRLPDGGLSGELESYLFVSELSPNYWGYSQQEFWSWLKRAHEGRV